VAGGGETRRKVAEFVGRRREMLLQEEIAFSDCLTRK
jgi:hypothetical protein